MTEACKHMIEVLKDTGLYHCRKGSGVWCEVKAYDAGFQVVEETFQRLLCDLLIQTATDQSLEARELLFRPEKSLDTLEKRRETLLMRGAISSEDNSLKKLNAMLAAAGIEGELNENVSLPVEGSTEIGLLINVRRLMGISQEEADRELLSILPAHLPWISDYGYYSWDVLEEENSTFQIWDAKDMSWRTFEELTVQ